MLTSDESEVWEIDVCIILPDENGDITENEDINDEDFREIILMDVTEELDIFHKDTPSTSHAGIKTESVGKKSDDFSTWIKIKLEKTRWNLKKKINISWWRTN